MKTFFKVLGIVFFVLIATMIVVPYFFKDNILEFAKKEANKSLNAIVEIDDVKLSMFSDFPNLNIEILNISISGKDNFKDDTIAKIDAIGANINLSSIINGDNIKTKTIYIKNANFNAIIDKFGKANWDIVKLDSNKTKLEENPIEDSSPIPNILFKDIALKNINVSFNDKKKNTYFSSKNININIAGNFSEQNTNINFAMTTPNTTIKYSNTKYLNKSKISFEASVNANLKDKIFVFKENKLLVNNLELFFQGQIDMNEEDIDINVNINTKNNDFKSILSIVPMEFKRSIKDIETNGKLNLSAFAKGKLYKNHLPAFGINLSIVKAQVKYPNLPESINNINIEAKISNAGGNIDNTIIDINKFHLDIAKNPFNFSLNVKKPISNPELKGTILGNIDLKKLKRAIPMKDIDLAGFINTNLRFDGKMSYIEKEQYELFKTTGSVTLTNFILSGKATPKPVKISKSVLTFSSRQINLKYFFATIGQSDLSLKGSIRNYIPFLIKNKILEANFKLTSKKLNFNEFLSEKETQTSKSNENTNLGIVTIPSNLNFKLNCRIKQMLYDKLIISNTNGDVLIKNSKAQLSNLKMQLLKGQLLVNGIYNVKDTIAPKVNFSLKAKDFDIESAYKSFSIIKKMVPMAMNCNGRISSSMNIKAILSQNMEIIPTSLNGKGSLNSKNILISNMKMLDGLASLTKDNNFKKVSVSKIDIKIDIVNGNITLKPFNTTIAGYPTTIKGSQSVDEKLNYSIFSKVDKKVLGNNLNNKFNNIPGYKNIKELDIELEIKGTLDKPIVKPNLNKLRKQIQKAATKELKKKVGKNLKKEAEKLFKGFFK